MNSVLFGLAAFSVTLNALTQIALRKTMLTIGAVPSSLSGILAFLLSPGMNLWFISLRCYQAGRIAGGFNGYNCHGEEKVRRIGAFLKERGLGPPPSFWLMEIHGATFS